MADRPLVIIHTDFEVVVIMNTKALMVKENMVIVAVEIAVKAIVRTESTEVACIEVEAGSMAVVELAATA